MKRLNLRCGHDSILFLPVGEIEVVLRKSPDAKRLAAEYGREG